MRWKSAVVGVLLAAVLAGASYGDGKIVASWTLTPGVRNPAVTQTTIDSTICVKGWTKTIRPPTRYTNELKLQQMPLYHESGDPRDYEEDHLISLELGGHPRDPRNLWPEPRPRANEVDKLETSLKRQVCARTITLRTAQKSISRVKHTDG